MTAMRASIPASIVLHAAIIGATLVAWNFTPPTPPTPPSIPISMVKIGPETNIEAAKALDVPDAQISPTPPQNAEGDPTPGDESGVTDSNNLKAPPLSKAVSEVPGPAKPVKPDEKPSQTSKSKDKTTDTKVLDITFDLVWQRGCDAVSMRDLEVALVAAAHDGGQFRVGHEHRAVVGH